MMTATASHNGGGANSAQPREEGDDRPAVPAIAILCGCLEPAVASGPNASMPVW